MLIPNLEASRFHFFVTKVTETARSWIRNLDNSSVPLALWQRYVSSIADGDKAKSTSALLETALIQLKFNFLFSGRNPISAPSRKNALFRIDITQEPDLRLIRRFFLKAY